MLDVITVDEAIKTVEDNFCRITGTETVAVSAAAGRVSANDVTAEENLPPFSRSVMDGYALIASDTYGASEAVPAMLDISGEVFMGKEADTVITNGKCVRIPTGGMLPGGANAVIPVENTEEDNGVCLVYKSVSVNENITRAGDDIKEGSVILRKGTVITPAHAGLLACAGFSHTEVVKRPLIGIISTGNEISPVDIKPAPGMVRDVNSHLLAAQCSSFGCDTAFYGIIKDDYNEIFTAVNKALSECDAVLISGGSSAGLKDMTAGIIENAGTVLAHGIAMKPGKPTILGKAGNKPVIGLPGHPAACFFVTEIIVRKIIDVLLGKESRSITKEFICDDNISSNHGREEFVCVKTDGERAVPVYGKSGLMSVICQSDGYIRIGRNLEGIQKGDKVTVYLFDR
ncbi:MAG: molybdopterin molybdotransferase MoeA [Clostridia bacterium]|nr:molybdopterin molybdotransferase MoeA [Clostridia bacterium]